MGAFGFFDSCSEIHLTFLFLELWFILYLFRSFLMNYRAIKSFFPFKNDSFFSKVSLKNRSFNKKYCYLKSLLNNRWFDKKDFFQVFQVCFVPLIF